MELSSQSTSVGELESHSAVIGQGEFQVSPKLRNCMRSRLNYSRPERYCQKGNLQTIFYSFIIKNSWNLTA